jgi:hypothetical protein
MDPEKSCTVVSIKKILFMSPAAGGSMEMRSNDKIRIELVVWLTVLNRVK